jgi:hypothetical protein
MNPYFTNKNNLLKTLEKYGVAVIPNVLDEKEIENARKGMWETLSCITSKFKTPIKEDDEESWKSFYELFPMHSMLLQHWKVGQTQFVWDLRQNPKIVDIFATLWQVKKEDLLTSFDGLSFHLPPEVTGKGFYKGNDWLHTDQSFNRSSFECAQAFVNLYDTNEDDATLVVLEKSHLYHGKFAEQLKMKLEADRDIENETEEGKDVKELSLPKEDWYKLNDEEKEFYDTKGCKKVRIACPKGSLVFWDSRTIHCGSEPLKTRKRPTFRLVVYICQTPRSLCSKADLKKKQKYFEEQRMTSHWPHKIKVFGKTPRTYGKELPEINSDIPLAELTDLGKRLAGY